MRKPRNPNTQSPEEQALWARIRADLNSERRAKREAGRRGVYEVVPFLYSPPEGGLKRGPKPDPTRDRAEVVFTARVTKRESAELRRHHRKLCKDASPSTFFRYVLCLWLEAHRDKSNGSEPFSFNPNDLDWRTKRYVPGHEGLPPGGRLPSARRV